MRRALALLPLAVLASAEFAPPWKDKVVRSPNRKYVVHAKRDRERRLTLEFGIPEKVLKRGFAAQLPYDIAVLDSGNGVVLFEKYGHLGHGDALALFDGTLAWRRKLGDLFDAETIAAFPQGKEQIRWFATWWVDGDTITLVGYGGHVREVSAVDGTILARREVDLLEFFEKEGLKPAAGEAVMKGLGQLGPDAAPTIVYLMSHADAPAGAKRAGVKALRRLPRDAVLAATIKEMRDADADLGGMLLTAAIATGAGDLHARLQKQESLLLKVLDKRTSDVGWLADHFKVRPTSEAIKPLAKALAAQKHDPQLSARIIAALKACTGQDHGTNPNAWLKALSRER